MRHFNYLHSLATGVVVLAVAMTGCEKKSETAAAPEKATPIAVNATCPVLGEPITAESPSVQFGTVTVAFCSDECVETWGEWSDEQKTEFVNASTTKKDELIEEMEDAGGIEIDG